MSSLKELGYTWASLPAAEIKPLQLLIRTGPGTAEQLNTNLSKLLLPKNIPVPLPSADMALPASLNLSEQLDTSVGASANFLQNLLRIFTGDVSASVAWEKHKNAEIVLNNARKQVLDLIDLDSYLHDAKVNDAAQSFVAKLKSDQLYIISEVIKTKTFSIHLEKGSSADISAEIPTQVANGKVKLEHDKNGKLVMTTDGDTDITVAVRAVRIFFDKPGFLSGKPGKFRLSAEEKLDVMKGVEAFPAKNLDVLFLEPENAGA